MADQLDLQHYRREYEERPLDVSDVAPSPIVQFGVWFTDAEESGLVEPNAAIVATADKDGRPSARHVLIKQVDDDGFVFYTNSTSRKGRQLAENPTAALCTAWSPIGRQVIIEGPVAPVDAETADAYFASRPRGSQIAAWASDQSATLPSRATLDARISRLERSLPDPVARPAHWWGYRVQPERIEFWQGRINRQHDRVLYRKVGGEWERERLAP